MTAHIIIGIIVNPGGAGSRRFELPMAMDESRIEGAARARIVEL